MSTAYRQQPLQYSTTVEWQTGLARFSFAFFLFFIFFGTSLPFREKDGFDAEVTSNVVNQIVFTLVFLMSLLSLSNRTGQLMGLVKRARWLFIFIGWAALTILWSNFPLLSAKRLFQICITVTSCLSILVHSTSDKDLIRTMKFILGSYVLVSLFSSLLIPGAIDAKFNTWRGIAATKNVLGQAALICSLFWYFAWVRDTGRSRILSLMFTVMSVSLLVGSFSMTSIGTFVALIASGVILNLLDRLFVSPQLGRLLSIVVMGGMFVLLAGTVFLAPDLLTGLPAEIGKDITFSGRTTLWESILVEIASHPWLGCGFSSYWNLDNIAMEVLHEDFIWLPNQAHNGYLDLLNENGIIGLGIVAILLLGYFRDLFRIDPRHFWKWYVAAILVINFQESSLFRPRHLVGVMFIFAYLRLYRQFQLEPDEQLAPDEPPKAGILHPN